MYRRRGQWQPPGLRDMIEWTLKKLKNKKISRIEQMKTFASIKRTCIISRRMAT